MVFVRLLDKKLKDFEIVELLENNGMQVIYNFDRSDEDIEDEYYSISEENGLELQFNDVQELKTIFLKFNQRLYLPREVDFPLYKSIDAVENEFDNLNLTYKLGAPKGSNQHIKVYPNNGRTNWLKGFSESGYIFYQFSNNNLSMVVLFSGENT